MFTVIETGRAVLNIAAYRRGRDSRYTDRKVQTVHYNSPVVTPYIAQVSCLSACSSMNALTCLTRCRW